MVLAGEPQGGRCLDGHVPTLPLDSLGTDGHECQTAQPGHVSTCPDSAEPHRQRLGIIGFQQGSQGTGAEHDGPEHIAWPDPPPGAQQYGHYVLCQLCQPLLGVLV